jgi:Lon protease-like protein
MEFTPMFPLGSVLSPGMVLPLHVFEPRYRRLVGDCLEGNREFGVVLIERGSEVGGGDVRSTVGTMATIADAAGLDDGRWAVVAVGVRRIRVVRWLDDDPYPRAEVEDWPDPPAGEQLGDVVASAIERLRRLLSLATEMGADGLAVDVEFSDDPVIAAGQVVALCPVGPSDRQRMLMAEGPEARMRLACTLIDEEVADLRAQLDLPGPGGGEGTTPPEW